MEDPLSSKKFTLTEGLLLAAIPIVAYYLAYQYEKGYFSAFAAPENLITIDISTFLLFASTLLGTPILFYNFLEPILTFRLGQLSKMSQKRMVFLLLLTFLSLWLLFSYLNQFQWIKAVGPPLTIVVLMLF